MGIPKIVKNFWSLVTNMDALKSLYGWVPAVVVSILTTIWGEISGAPSVILFVIFLITLASTLVITYYIFMIYHKLKADFSGYDKNIDKKLQLLHKEGAKLGTYDLKMLDVWHEKVRNYISNEIPEFLHIIDTNASVANDRNDIKKMLLLDSLGEIISKYHESKK